MMAKCYMSVDWVILNFRCPPGWTGSNCDVRNDTLSSTLSNITWPNDVDRIV